jgi:hypothetical protein
MAMVTDKTFITNKNLYTILVKPNTYNLNFILGILNSRLLSYLYVNQITQATKDDFPQVTIKDVLDLPFPLNGIKIPDKIEKNITVLVLSAIDLIEKFPNAKTEQEKTILSRQIDSTDKRIDDLVYELYGLTEEEIKIVEGDNA